MGLPAGSRIGPYEIQAMLGAGGMGEVYRARDTRLGRDVAVKVLPEMFAADAERMARFEREAQLLASLNHPNIAIIHGLEESGGTLALVMELVEGPTLADLLERRARPSGPAGLPLDETLPIAHQIADALEAAHERGVVHRDLKPANIKVTADGKVKVLDFGLAKLTDTGAVASGLSRKPQDANLTASPTLSVQATMAGVILGTAAYMSPEQARGKPVDRRTDIWAFGCVLYEMLTGKQTFAAGETVSDAIAAILKNEPDWSALPDDTGAHIRTLLRRCLQKDPQKRLPHIGVARLEIEEGTEVGAGGGARGTAPPASVPRRERLAWAAGLAVVALIAAGALTWALRPPALLPETRVEINTPPTTDPFSFAISPNGRQVVFVASGDGPPRLWLRSLDAVAAQALPGTEGAQLPFWSPDSQSVAFFADGALKRLDISGGPPRTLAKAPAGRGGTWSDDGIILFSPRIGTGLFRTSATGGEAVAVTTVAAGQLVHFYPQFLPGGRQFLFYSAGAEGATGIYLGSLDGAEVTRVTPADAAGLYAPPGWLLFPREGTLVAWRFDRARGELTGEPVTVADAIGVNAAFGGAFSVSATGSVMYRTGAAGLRQLTWFDRSGKALGTAGEADLNLFDPVLSPDGRRVAAVRRTVQDNTDVWLIDALRATRFTFGANPEMYPVWSPDGNRIVFSRTQPLFDLYQKPSSGAGSEELLQKSSQNKAGLDWSPDGRFLLYAAFEPNTANDLWVLPMEGDGKPFVFMNSAFDERQGEFSPDGRWVAYQSNESGRNEVYVRPFPGPGGQWQVSTGGGIAPRWRSDGKELYYVAPDAALMAAPIIASGAVLEPGAPTALFRPRILFGGTSAGAMRWQYDVAPDGRFLINVETGEATVSPITLILNWNPERR